MAASSTKRRWFQFSLRMLLAAVLVCAVPAWWFRPGVIRPSFALVGFSREFVEAENRERVFAQIKLTNSGPDAIWITGDYFYNEVFRQPYEGYSDGSFSAGLGGAHLELGSIRLKPAESYIYAIELDDKAADIQLTVTVQDRRRSYERECKSPRFNVPEEIPVGETAQ